MQACATRGDVCLLDGCGGLHHQLLHHPSQALALLACCVMKYTERNSHSARTGRPSCGPIRLALLALRSKEQQRPVWSHLARHVTTTASPPLVRTPEGWPTSTTGPGALGPTTSGSPCTQVNTRQSMTVPGPPRECLCNLVFRAHPSTWGRPSEPQQPGTYIFTVKSTSGLRDPQGMRARKAGDPDMSDLSWGSLAVAYAFYR